MARSLGKKVSDKIRLVIALPFNVLAFGQGASPPYQTNTRMQRVADWVNTHIVPDDLD